MTTFSKSSIALTMLNLARRNIEEKKSNNLLNVNLNPNTLGVGIKPAQSSQNVMTNMFKAPTPRKKTDAAPKNELSESTKNVLGSMLQEINE